MTYSDMGYAAVLLGFIVFLANVVETVLGFGNTLLAVSLAGTFLPIDFLIPTLVPVNLALSLYIITRHRRHLQWPALGRKVLPLILLGLGAGLAVFTLAESRALRLGYGAFVLVYALWGLMGWVRERVGQRVAGEPRVVAPAIADQTDAGQPAPLGPSPLPADGPTTVFVAHPASGAGREALVASLRTPPPAGRLPALLPLVRGAALLLGSGFFQGLYAAGGPMLVAYADREFGSKGSFRATLSAVWALLGAVMVTTYALTGKLTARTLATSAWLLPVLVVAILAGEWLHARASQAAFRLAVLTLLLVAGLSFLL